VNVPAGVGLGLRWAFLEELLESAPALPFVEVSPENYMRRGGYFPAALSQVREKYPVISHGLTLSIGGTDELDRAYLRELRSFVREVGADLHSDHLCWSGTKDNLLHDLLPLPFTEEAIHHVAGRIRQVQDALELPIGIENVTYYAPLGTPAMSEADFVLGVLEESGAKLLLDVNNVFVNSVNHREDPLDFLRKMPLDRVAELHVAGHHTWSNGLVVDTHGATVPDPVYELMAWVIERAGPRPVLLERDTDIPPLADLLDEVAKLQTRYDEAVAVFDEAARDASAGDHAPARPREGRGQPW
jgi:uncharacterized protein